MRREERKITSSQGSGPAGSPPGSELDVDNPEFRAALNLVEHTQRSVFLTGKAGTGKSTFLRYVTAHTRKRHVVLAPTGIAAVNVGGQTLHSFFKIPFKPLLPDDPEFAPSRLRERMKYSRSFIKLLAGIDLIIIDEISMVRADIIDFIDKILRTYCRNKREPFAGKQLLFVGDIFQLEPVVTSDMRQVLSMHYVNPYFFSADVFRQVSLVSVELRKVYRQDEPRFVEMLDRLRAGILDPADRDAINARVAPPAPAEAAPDSSGNPHAKATEEPSKGEAKGRKNKKKAPKEQKMVMTLATRRDVVEHINQEKLALIKRPERIFVGKVTGDFPESSLPAPRELCLKEGAQVVFVKNDRERRWVNGSVGRITSCLPDQVEVELEDGSRHIVEPERWPNIIYTYDEKRHTVTENEIGAFTQLPLKLAWALTIHKSQGLTFSNLIIDMTGGAFTSGQTYVAMSRCRSLDGITLKAPLGPRDVFVSRAVSDFSRTFNDTRAMQQALEEAARRERLADSAMLWREGKRPEAVATLLGVLREDPRQLSDPRLERLLRIKVATLPASLDAPSPRELALEARLQAREAQLRALADEYCELGHYCLDGGGDLTPALANFDKALRLDPGCISAMIGRGAALADLGELHEAMDQLLRAREALDRLDPDAQASAAPLARRLQSALASIDSRL
ncbi:MAG: AAA family ATPase [Candidatus Amulumruptor caecigallinarius]|nr:AAA family ATPase [Candidatus Amulumruptor caecigallinarius]MCM1397103.1 AAA family ATPase [Candidatus Amulumruptor caecigallinarius]MCM1454089.1 AAA family ATPase [bacterium]